MKKLILLMVVVGMLVAPFVTPASAEWGCNPPEPYVDYDPEYEPWYPWAWWNWRTSEAGVSECGPI